MKKVRKLLLLAVAALSLSGCDMLGNLFGGGEDEEERDDFNLYSLQLTVNKQGAEFQDIGLSYEGMDDEEKDLWVSEYGSKGCTRENLDKNGTMVDGKYLFMYEEGFKLKAPLVVGYNFDGWYNGDKRIDGGVDLNYDGWTDYLVNMPQANTVLQARYSVIDYTFRVSKECNNHSLGETEIKTWNIEQGDYELPTNDLEGKTFKQWKFNGHYFKHSEGIVNVAKGEQPMPESYKTIENVAKIDKDFLTQLGDVAYGYCADLETDLYAVYETQKCTATVKWVGEADAGLYIMVNHSDLFGTYHWISDAINNEVEGASNPLTFTCNYGDEIEIYYHLADGGYTFDGFFVDNSQTADKTTIGSYTFTITKNTTIEMKLTSVE